MKASKAGGERCDFYRVRHGEFLHEPTGIGAAIRRGMDASKAKGYTVKPPYLMLEEETGPFSANVLIAVKEIPENDPNVVVWTPNTLYSIYYQGVFRGTRQQVRNLIEFFESMEKPRPKKIYTWVTNCPKCWKEQGGPTTVLFAAD